MPDRKQIQDVFIRVCQDSGFTTDVVDAAHFAAAILNITAIEVWAEFSSLHVMTEIAEGTHPAAKKFS